MPHRRRWKAACCYGDCLGRLGSARWSNYWPISPILGKIIPLCIDYHRRIVGRFTPFEQVVCRLFPYRPRCRDGTSGMHDASRAHSVGNRNGDPVALYSSAR